MARKGLRDTSISLRVVNRPALGDTRLMDKILAGLIAAQYWMKVTNKPRCDYEPHDAAIFRLKLARFNNEDL